MIKKRAKERGLNLDNAHGGSRSRGLRDVSRVLPQHRVGVVHDHDGAVSPRNGDSEGGLARRMRVRYLLRVKVVTPKVVFEVL